MIKRDSAIALYNERIQFNKLRRRLKTKIESEKFPTLKQIAAYQVSTFFTHETSHYIHSLEIPENLKGDIKRCVC